MGKFVPFIHVPKPSKAPVQLPLYIEPPERREIPSKQKDDEEKVERGVIVIEL